MSLALHGFVVRAARPDESSNIANQCGDLGIGGGASPLTLVAIGAPGEVVLGAIAVTPGPGGKMGYFRLLVRPEARRRGIGRRLVQHLYHVARGNGAQRLVLAELIHQEAPENAFCSAVGLTPEARLATYTFLLADGLRVCDPILRRFGDTHRHLKGTQVVPLDQIDAQRVADFVARNYHGLRATMLQQLNSEFYDRALSVAALREENLLAVSLYRSQPGQSAITLELTLVAKDLGQSPLGLLLGAENARRALAVGKTHIAYEADEIQDPFAVGFARRCNASPGAVRFRYAIDAQTMGELLEAAAPANATGYSPPA